jgi:hypothetical protein
MFPRSRVRRGRAYLNARSLRPLRQPANSDGVRKEPFPILTLLRKARFRVLKGKIAIRKEMVGWMGAGLQNLEDTINSLDDRTGDTGTTDTSDDTVDDSYTVTGDFPDTAEEEEVPVVTKPPGGKPPTGKLTRRDAVLMLTFAHMEGEGSEFTTDNRPKVAEVNERIETLGHDPANRAEIDRVFEVYLDTRPEKITKNKKVTAREDTLREIFGKLHKSEFTSEGKPQVGAVNDRLEALGQEHSSRDEINKAFQKFSGA